AFDEFDIKASGININDAKFKRRGIGFELSLSKILAHEFTIHDFILLNILGMTLDELIAKCGGRIERF
ncbi:MAG: hypothetical protein ABIB65_00855, partial [Candidatus Margulisiibacteriota bacterium]